MLIWFPVSIKDWKEKFYYFSIFIGKLFRTETTFYIFIYDPELWIMSESFGAQIVNNIIW